MYDDIELLRKRVQKALHEKQKCIRAILESTGKKNEINRQKLVAINEKYWVLQEKLDYYDSILIGEDEEIEVKRFGENLENMYSIYLKDLKVKIGHIDYRGYHDSLITGDIGYVIDARYRGHNYAYKALCLLSNYLYDNGIMDFYISVFKDNLPSTKIIEKYGGEVIQKENRLTTYQCETRKKEKVKST